MKPIQLRIKEDNFLTNSTTIDDAIQKVGFPCIITIRKDIAGLSENQRNYYFGVPVKIIQDYTGYTKDETHRMLKRSYLPDYEKLLGELSDIHDDEDNAVDDVRRIMQRFLQIHEDLTITNETTGSFEEYLKRIRESYSRHNVHIPLPNEDQKWEGWERML